MSSKNEAMLSVAEVFELPAGKPDEPTWINPGCSGVVRSMTERKTKTGKQLWNCVLADQTGSATVEVSFFSQPSFKEGDLIELSGQGLRRTEYNGKAQVRLSAKTEIHRLGASVHHAEQVQAAAECKPSVSGEPQHVFGATAGMAVKAALEHVTAQAETPKASDPKYWEQVWEYASDVVRIARMIESGKLAKPVKERAGLAGEDVPY
jgi:hypothetical protein